MIDPDVKIIRQTEDATFADGVTTRWIVVTFRVGPHGPFTVKVPKDGFTAQKRDDAVMALAREVRAS